MSDLVDLVERLGSAERPVQRGACDEARERLRSEPELRPQIVRLLHAGSRHGRFAAAFVLFNAEGPALRLLPALLDALDLDDGDLRWSAAHMIAVLGRAKGEVLPVLVHETTAGPSPRRRRMALYALRELAPEREETARALLDALSDADPAVRNAALSSLAKLSDPPRACLERVLALLADESDPRQQSLAAVVLPELLRGYPDALSSAQGELERAAAGSDASLARAAALALQRLDR